MGSLARWGTLLVLAAPHHSWALSVGNIESNSYLNERLDAVIPLTATEEELNGLRVAMAPMAQFAATGLEYPSVLGSIDLRVERNSRGEPVIRLSSDRLITEAFLTMLIEVRSGRSTVYSEQTILLDLPTFLADEVPAAPVAAPVTREEPQTAGGGQIARQPAAPVPQPAATAPQPATVAPPAAAAANPSLAAGDYSVQNGDTLWDIVQQVRPAGVTTNQAMVAVFEANPSAFSGNMNRLRRGAILRIPPAAQLNTMSAAAATAEVARQDAAWRGGAQSEPRLVLIPPSEDAGAGGAVSPAEDSGRVAELEDEVSDLSAELAATRARLEEAERLLELRSAELANVQNLADQAEAEAEAAPAGDEIFVDDEVVADDSAVFVEDAVEADEPEVAEPVAASERATAVPAVTRVDSGPSLVEQIIAMVTRPIVLGVVAVLVVLIGALAFLRRRRDDDDIDDVTGQWQALESELEEEAAQADGGAAAAGADLEFGNYDGTGTVEEPLLGEGFDSDAFDHTDGDLESAGAGTMEIPTPVFPSDYDDTSRGGGDRLPLADQTLSSQTVINLDHDDPIAEADFHMAYGLYDQAAELLTRALGDEPDNQALRLKLLEVFFVWGNKESFLEQAQMLRSTIGGGAEWDKVVIMGKQICPDEPLFAEATAAAGVIDLDFESSADSSGLDFAFGDSSDQGVELDLEVEDADEEVDLRLEASGAHEQAVEPVAGDETLEIGERTQAGIEAALFMEDDEDEAAAATAEVAGGSDDDDDSSDFVLDSSLEPTMGSSTAEAPEATSQTMQTPTLESSGLVSFESGDTMEQPRPAAEMTAEIELDDLGLDLGDIDDLPDETGERGAAEGGALGSSGIDFVLDGPAPNPDSTLSATGVTQVLDVDESSEISLTGTAVLGGDDYSLLSYDDDDDDSMDSINTSTEVLEKPVAGFGPGLPETEDDLDLNLDDFSSALGDSDTVEHNVSATFSEIDLDVGADVSGDEEPTGTEEYSPLDPQTMTEVGTKLDLARAYIDMGDPEGAKSILEEVLSEGDAGQRNEAKALISALPG